MKKYLIVLIIISITITLFAQEIKIDIEETEEYTIIFDTFLEFKITEEMRVLKDISDLNISLHIFNNENGNNNPNKIYSNDDNITFFGVFLYLFSGVIFF